MPRHPRARRLASLCAAVLVVPAVGVATTAPAGATATRATAVTRAALPGNPGNGPIANANPQTTGRCSPATSRKVAGTLIGTGNKGLNATIGVDLLDRNGTKINVLNGCPSGGAYGAVVQTNHYVGGAGQAIGSEERDGRGRGVGVVDPRWAVEHLPANVVQVFVETYNRTYSGSPCGLSCAGTQDTSHFSQVNLRNVPAGSAGNLKLTPLAISKTGSLKLVFNRTDVTSVNVFSFSGSGSSNGWAVTKPARGSRAGKASTWMASALPANARGYLLQVSYSGGQVHKPTASAKTGYKVKTGTTTTYHVTLP